MEIQVKGLKELDNALSRFPEEIQRRVLSAALRKASKPMRDDVAAHAPVRDPDDPGPYLKKRKHGKVSAPGHLKAHIFLRVRSIHGIPTAIIGWSRDAFWGMFRELGTAHEAAVPFMRPAFDSGVAQLLRDFAFELRLGVERAAKKFYKKAS